MNWWLPSHLRRHHLAVAAATLTLFVVIIYVGVLQNHPVWDDVLLTSGNKYLTSLRGCAQLFTHDMWSASAQGDPGLYYRPVTMLTFAINRAVGGDSAASYHIANVLLHIVAALLVLALIRHLPRTLAGPGPMVAAVTFAVLPLHVEAVAWTSGRFDVLASVFATAAFVVHLRPGRSSATGTAVLFALALLSKESAICLPLLLVTYDLLFDRQILRLHWPTYVALLALVFLGYVLARRSGVDGLLSLAAIGVGRALEAYVFGLMTFLPRVVWPVGLDAFHVYRAPSAVVCAVVLGGVLVVTIALSVAQVRRQQPWSQAALFGWIWFLVAMVPVAFAGPRLEMIGDRHAYLPSVGLALSFAAVTDAVYVRIKPLRAGRFVLGAIAVLLAAMWTGQGLASADRVRDWRDEASLFAASIRADPDNHIAHRSLAVLAAREGKLEDAERHLRRSLELAPDSWRAWSLLCYTLLNRDKLDEAEQACMRGLQGFPREPRIWVNLASIYARQRRWADCARACDEALARKRDYAEAYYLRGVSFANLGQYEKARRDAVQALALEPQHPAAGTLLRQLDQRGL